MGFPDTYYVAGDDISFCIANNLIVLLDISRDRYWALPRGPGAKIARLIAGADGAQSACEVSRILLRYTKDQHDLYPEPVRVESQPPIESLDLTDIAAARPSILGVFGVFWCVLLAWASLKALGMRAAVPKDMSSAHCSPINAAAQQHLTLHVLAYEKYRKWVPISRRCLVDSLSLKRYLRSHEIFTQLIIGVQVNPFSAHCWLQAGDMAVNQSLEAIRWYVPIRAAA
jgi:hypothetical protein